ncbi:UDP-glucose/GDP-mannose dehydrogenase family protein [Lujinxingia vulgaris]|uniref:UDP-glucose 6-dehydrogenase n=1 Tax=Lujinxingia vulgaris TaxID=2600176 RepID=A0A5C6XKH5_9DELT|nr:UDP-glucose/GDP-mannose dehydrogenase family protein [Lujinxingia vulgaris]TXD42825.1 UDP-glucose/GDP-mannose dehydrogenase family protein [Lujinxingia vulgaris]
MNLTIIGTGYVGLVTGTCFAEMGHQVTCVDVDARKVAQLRKGKSPIFEPGLDELLQRNIAQKRLRFSTSLAEACEAGEVFFIAVGTPPDQDGSADLQHVLEVARQLGEHLQGDAIVVDKSTVPVGTARMVQETIEHHLEHRGAAHRVVVVSNPEFLKEGAAIDDFMKPDRIIIGTEDEQAREHLAELYAPFNRNHQRLLFMGTRDAEMTKYAANAMLATKISFMNEVAHLCEALGVDVENVRLGIGSDERIGYHFIYPGCGYGGSCFPKDVRALCHMARDQGIEPGILDAVERRNQAQKERLAQKIIARYGEDLSALTFGLWGLAFKPGTDDLREAPSRTLLEHLIARGARIQAYDPVAMEAAREHFPQEWFDRQHLMLAEHQYAALEGVDALILVTEWKPFRHPDLGAMARLMRHNVIFDGRNQYDPHQMRAAGFYYDAIGRSSESRDPATIIALDPRPGSQPR